MRSDDQLFASREEIYPVASADFIPNYQDDYQPQSSTHLIEFAQQNA
jgi:hypothetical protein